MKPMKLTYDARQLRNALEESTSGDVRFEELAKRDFDETFGPRVRKVERDENYFLLKAFFYTYETASDSLTNNGRGSPFAEMEPMEASRPWFEVGDEEEEDFVDLEEEDVDPEEESAM